MKMAFGVRKGDQFDVGGLDFESYRNVLKVVSHCVWSTFTFFLIYDLFLNYLWGT
jgi:hypothetical protein